MKCMYCGEEALTSHVCDLCQEASHRIAEEANKCDTCGTIDAETINGNDECEHCLKVRYIEENLTKLALSIPDDVDLVEMSTNMAGDEPVDACLFVTLARYIGEKHGLITSLRMNKEGKIAWVRPTCLF